MLNTPYERGWRDAAAGRPARTPELEYEARAYTNGYQECRWAGYAIEPIRTCTILPPATPRATLLGRLKSFANKLQRIGQ